MLKTFCHQFDKICCKHFVNVHDTFTDNYVLKSNLILWLRLDISIVGIVSSCAKIKHEAPFPNGINKPLASVRRSSPGLNRNIVIAGLFISYMVYSVPRHSYTSIAFNPWYICLCCSELYHCTTQAVSVVLICMRWYTSYTLFVWPCFVYRWACLVG